MTIERAEGHEPTIRQAIASPNRDRIRNAPANRRLYSIRSLVVAPPGHVGLRSGFWLAARRRGGAGVHALSYGGSHRVHDMDHSGRARESRRNPAPHQTEANRISEGAELRLQMYKWHTVPGSGFALASLPQLDTKANKKTLDNSDIADLTTNSHTQEMQMPIAKLDRINS
jgi:hypothetical protein